MSALQSYTLPRASRRTMLAAATAGVGAWFQAPGTAFAQAVPAGTPDGARTASTPAGNGARWVESNGTSLRCEFTGAQGPVVVLIHEMTSALETWDEVLPALSTGRRVLRYDFRGAGLSGRVRGTVTYEDHAADLRGLLDALQLKEPIVLVGSAMGACIASHFAAASPERVKALALLSPAIGLDPRPGFLSIVRKIEEVGLATYMQQWNEDIYPKSIRTAERWERYRGMERACDQESVLALLRMLAATGSREVLPRIKCPTLVVHTSLWPRPEADIRQIAQLIPSSHFEVVRAGHYSPLESPEAILPGLLRFLGRTAG